MCTGYSMPVLCGMKKCPIYALHYRQAPLNITSIAGRCLADCKCVIPGVIIFISFMHIITTDGKLTLPTSMIYPCVFYYLPSNAITLIFVIVLGHVRLMGLSVVCNELMVFPLNLVIYELSQSQQTLLWRGNEFCRVVRPVATSRKSSTLSNPVIAGSTLDTSLGLTLNHNMYSLFYCLIFYGWLLSIQSITITMKSISYV
ncbi:MAG: hypothetical protein EXX96DRAFT_542086 [Benjaminiella poitrasii]|nr:MAG: hypothetical protein EXX96DRAFT_542086 [Benjaminiella poitrasii]